MSIANGVSPSSSLCSSTKITMLQPCGRRSEGMQDASCALVGGETAEMPGMYKKQDDYDAAGAAIGVMIREFELPRRSDMVAGDVLIGLASNGVPSDGFSSRSSYR